MGTKSVCSPVTKSSNGFGHTNLDHSRTHKIEKPEKNGFGPFSYKFFVCIRVGLRVYNIYIYIPVKSTEEVDGLGLHFFAVEFGVMPDIRTRLMK